MENENLVTDFKRKSHILNTYFAKQCPLFEIESSLPGFTANTLNNFTSFEFACDDIVSIIAKMNPKKAHGWDNISVSLVKLCSNEIAVPLKLIFSKCLEVGIFPSKWKYANVQPVHKKDSRQLVSNYRPISLLPIFGKIFEKIMFDSMYSFFQANQLITRNQSGFRPGDSTINQLLSITTEIC